MKISSPEYDPGDAVWRKSSYSGGEGGNCLEVATSSKSTRSGAGGGDCLDAAADRPCTVPVRDSKNPDGPKLVFRTAAWSAFVDGVSDAPQTGR